MQHHFKWYFILLFTSFLSAQTGTVGAPSIGDSIFTSEGNGGIDVTNYDLDIRLGQ